MVYFIQSGRFVRVGRVHGNDSSKVDEHLRLMRQSHPAKMKLLGTFRGGAAMLSMIHKRLSEDRAHADWFKSGAGIDYVLGRTQDQLNAGLDKIRAASAATRARNGRLRKKERELQIQYRRVEDLHVPLHEVAELSAARKKFLADRILSRKAKKIQ